MSLFAKAKQLYQKYKLAKEYVDAINDLPPTYNMGKEISDLCDDIGKGRLNIKQVFPDPVSEETIKRKLDRVNKAEKAWKDYCAINNC